MAETVVTRPEGRTGSRVSLGPQSAARWTNVVLGAWLFISAWIWQHTPESQTNTWILGVIIFAVGLISLAIPPVRFVNTAASIWLFFSTLWMPHIYIGTTWHNCILAVIVFIVSLIPSRRLATTRTTVAPTFGRREVHP